MLDLRTVFDCVLLNHLFISLDMCFSIARTSLPICEYNKDTLKEHLTWSVLDLNFN